MKIKELSKKTTKKIAICALGAATATATLAFANTNVDASVDYSVYKEALDSKLVSKGIIDVDIIENGVTSNVLIDARDIDTLADKIAYQQYYVANLLPNNNTSGDASTATGLESNATAVTDNKGQITTILKDGFGSTIAQNLSVADLEMLKLNSNVTIPEFDNNGRDTGNTVTVQNVTVTDLFTSGSANKNGQTFDGTGNIQDTIDYLQNVMDKMEDAGWN